MQSSLSEIALRSLASNLGSEWKSLATHLKVRKDEIDRIQADNQVAEDQIFQMLMTWWQRWDHQSDDGNNGDLDALCDALVKSGRSDLIGSLKSPLLYPDNLNLDLCRAEFIRFYKDAMGQVPLLPWLSSDVSRIEDIFVQLKLMESKSSTARVVKREIGSYEEMLLLHYHEDDQPVRYILLCGVAGSGKTTIVSRIAYDWALQRPGSSLSKFGLLVALNLRELKSTSDLTAAIFDQILPEDTAVSPDALRHYLKSHADEVLVILDGVDEFGKGGSQLPDDGDVIKIISNKILRGCTVVVTTRPHMVDTLSKLNPHFSQVETKGFSDDAILQYIERFFQDEDPQIVSELYSLIMGSDNLHDLAKLPMMLLITCLVWSEDYRLPDTLTETFREAVYFILKRHFKDSDRLFDGAEDDFLENELKELVSGLGRAALDGLLLHGQKLVFKPSDFANSAVVEKACKIGILSQERVRSKLRAVQNVTFIHKTIQEAIAGFYLADLADSDEALFHRYLSKVNVENVFGHEYLLRFCSGARVSAARVLLRHAVATSRVNYEESFLLFLLMHLEAKSEELHYIATPLFELQGLFFSFSYAGYPKMAFEFLIKCASQSPADRFECCSQSFLTGLKRVVLVDVTEIDIPVVAAILNNAVNASDVVLGLGGDDKSSGMERDVLVSLGEALRQMPSLVNLSLFPSQDLRIDLQRELDLVVVVGRLADAARCLQVFVLQSVCLGARHFQMLQTQRSQLFKLLALSGGPASRTPQNVEERQENRPPMSLQELEEELYRVKCYTTCLDRSPQLQVLQLFHSSIQTDLLPVSVLLSKAPSLQVVDLSRNKIGDAFPSIARSLSQLGNLKELRLSETGLSAEQVALLAEEVLPFLVNLRILSLSHNYISRPDAVLAVVQWACNSSSLKELYLGACVEMQPKPAESCVAERSESVGTLSAETPQTRRSSVEIFDCQMNYLGDCTPRLMRFLTQMPALKSCNMSCMALTDSDAVDLAQVLSESQQMQHLFLEGNINIGDEGMKALLTALPRQPHIQLLHMPFDERHGAYSDVVHACLKKCRSKIPGCYVFRRPQIEAVVKILEKSAEPGLDKGNLKGGT